MFKPIAFSDSHPPKTPTPMDPVEELLPPKTPVIEEDSEENVSVEEVFNTTVERNYFKNIRIPHVNHVMKECAAKYLVTNFKTDINSIEDKDYEEIIHSCLDFLKSYRELDKEYKRIKLYKTLYSKVKEVEEKKPKK